MYAPVKKSLPMALLTLALALSPTILSAQCPTILGEGAIGGVTKFNTVKSQMWHNDGVWWGIFSDSTTGLSFYTFENNAGTKGSLIDSNSSGIPDVLWDGTNLFVSVWKSTSLATLYKYSYNSLNKTHTLLSGFPIALALTGGSTSALVLDKDSTGKLWATYTGTEGGLADGKVRVIWSTSPDHTVWDTTGTTLESDLVPNTTEISAITHFGGNKIGIAWTNQPAMEIAFRYHVDGEPETTWSAKETIDSGLGPRGLGPVADDHLSIKAAPDGRVFLVAKDRDNDGTPAHQNEARLWLYTRSVAGSWGSKTAVQSDPTQFPTRPVLLLDATGNLVYVIYHESVSGLNFITHSPMDSPIFDSPCVFSNTPSSNPTSTKQNLTPTMGLMAATSTGATSTNEILFRRVALVSPNVLKCDVGPRPNGNGTVSIVDWVQMGRFVAGLDTPNPGSEFQRADSAPSATHGDGAVTIADWVQCGRYAAKLDPPVALVGPAKSQSAISSQAGAPR